MTAADPATSAPAAIVPAPATAAGPMASASPIPEEDWTRAVGALRQAVGPDARSWDVAAMGIEGSPRDAMIAHEVVSIGPATSAALRAHGL